MYHSISRDVKIAAIKLFERHLLDLEDILDCCGFSERTWYRVLKLWRTTGDVVSDSKSLRGRLRLVDHNDIHYLLDLIHRNPDYFLDELQYLLKTNRFISINFTTIHRELRRAGVSRKKLQRIAQERNDVRRAEFIARMAQYSPEELGFIDEVSRDERTVSRHYGRSRKGCRSRKQPFVQGRRTSTVAVLTLEGFVSATSVEGSLTKAAFLEWLEFGVVRLSSLAYLIRSDHFFSYLNVVPTLDPSASSYSTTLKYTTMMKYSSSSTDLVYALNICLPTHPISTQSRKLFRKSNIFCGAIKITMPRQMETTGMGFFLICMKF